MYADAVNSRWHSLLWLTLFAVAMAFLEAAVVVYLRQAYYPDNLLVIFPPTMLSVVDMAIELARETATLVMMLAVALLAARERVARCAVFLYLFGLWDIFYYVWLKLTLGWPVAWTEWDILFLMPWAWLGPWLAAAAIAALFVLWGGTILISTRSYRMPTRAVLSFIIGALLALASFLQPGASYLAGGIDAFATFQPDGFWWPLYLAGYALMAVALWGVLRTGRG